jgi:hypothetical protein
MGCDVTPNGFTGMTHCIFPWMVQPEPHTRVRPTEWYFPCLTGGTVLGRWCNRNSTGAAIHMGLAVPMGWALSGVARVTRVVRLPAGVLFRCDMLCICVGHPTAPAPLPTGGLPGTLGMVPAGAVVAAHSLAYVLAAWCCGC